MIRYCTSDWIRYKQQKFISHPCGDWGVQDKCWQILHLLRAHFLVYRQRLLTGPHMVEGTREISGAFFFFFIKALEPSI